MSKFINVTFENGVEGYINIDNICIITPQQSWHPHAHEGSRISYGANEDSDAIVAYPHYENLVKIVLKSQRVHADIARPGEEDGQPSN